MGSCHSSKPNKSKIGKQIKSKSCLNQSILVDEDNLTLKNNDLSAYIDLNSSIFQKRTSPSMSSLTSTNSVLSSESSSSNLSKQASATQRTIPVLSRLVYKPKDIVTSTSSIITTGSSKQSGLTKSLSTSPPSTSSASIQVTTHIKIEQVPESKSNGSKKVNLNNRREFSPFRSFIKAPTSVLNNQSVNRPSFSSSSSLTKHNQSSSLSSISSTSSSISNNKSIENKSKSNLVPPKKVVPAKPTPIKSNVLPSPSKVKTLNTSIPSFSKSENPETKSTNKRLFSPYKFSSKPSVLTENINRDNSNTDQVNKKIEQQQTTLASQSKENTTTTTNTVTTTTTQIGISKLKFSYNKIPAPSKSNIKSISQTNNKKSNENNGTSSLLKRDDSAYNSSTSSTVSSSNDGEETKDDVKLDEHKIEKSRRSKTSIEESVGELNQLIVSSSSICSTLSTSPEEKSEHKEPTQPHQPIFKPPSNLPPVENGEVITLDIETYRLLLQDLQSCKIVLHKLGSLLKEPSILNESGQDNHDEVPNLLLSSFYQHNNPFDATIEKVDQSTQTE